MGQNFDQVSSHTQDELRGGTRLVPIRTVAFTTKPSGIYAEHRLDLNAIDVTQIGPILELLAQGLEEVAQRPDVAAVSYLQDVNAAGQLIDTIEVVVQSTSGNSTEAVLYPLEDVVALSFGTSTSTKEKSIPQVVAELDAIEAL